MIKRVVVGVDFSAASKLALDTAFLWARKVNVPLMAVHVLMPPMPMFPESEFALPDSDWRRTMANQAQEQLDSLVVDMPGTETRIVWGSPAEELVSAATPDCLLVVAQVGHSPLERLLFGSTASRVVSHAPCDVLVVRGEGKKKR